MGKYLAKSGITTLWSKITEYINAKTAVDAELSSESENPVQNKVINSRLESIDSDIADLQDEINTFSGSSIESYVSGIDGTPKRSTSSLIYIVSHTNTSTGVSTGTSLTIPEATSDYAGLMTAEMYSKLEHAVEALEGAGFL